ncbi:MAG: TPM domain-containing protein [Caulobacteraceae bacterium]|nr:TPM domain-containing protein [Caulobacteraceae bacterium]
MTVISPEDHKRINAAIAEAETTTSGEIFCILARESSAYREVPLAWAAAAALVLPAALIPLGFGPAWFDWAPRFGGWTAAHAAAVETTTAVTLLAYAATQAVTFLVAAALVALPPVRRALTPRALKRARTHQAAVEQFLAKGLHLTAGRTGVLIFASLSDRQAEIVADEGIYAKVKPEVWEQAVARLTEGLREGRPGDGFVGAIQLCGSVLAQHFPPGLADRNEIPDALVEI